MPDLLELQTMSGVHEPITDTFEEVYNESVEGEKMISFSVYKTERNTAIFDLIAPKEGIIFEGERYVIDPWDRNPIGTTVEKTITARHEVFDMLKAEFHKTETTGDLRITRCLELALANTGVTFEFVGATLPSESFENFGNATGLDMLQTTMSRFECEYRIYGRHLVVAKEIARVTDAQFRHGHNLRSISEHQDSTDIITYVEGWGRLDEETGQPVVKATYESDLSGRYTDHVTGKKRLYKAFFQDDRYTTQAGINAEVRRRATGLPSYHLEIEYEELRRNGFKLHNYLLGDYIWAIHEQLQLDIQARVISIERYPYNPSRSPIIELGSFRRDITNKINQFEQTTKRVEQVAGTAATARQEAGKAQKAATTAQTAAEQAQAMVENSSSTITNHINDGTIHVSQADRDRWNNNPSSGEVDADIEAVLGIVNQVDQKASAAQVAANAAFNQANNRNRLRALFIGNGTQTVYSLPFSYVVGKNQLDVYVGYTKRISGTPSTDTPVGFTADYIETTSTQITFTTPPPANAPIEVLIREVSS